MITHLISSNLRRKLLTHYFTHPDEKYYVRELAALLNLDPGNLSKELRLFEKEGLFRTEQKGRVKFFKLNPEHPLYPELKQIIFKTEGIEGSLRELVSQFPKIKLSFIYGSYAQGKETETSDVDVMIVGNPNRDLLTNKIRDLEQKLRREINFNLYPEPEFNQKRSEKGSFLAQVAAGKTILLKGDLHG